MARTKLGIVFKPEEGPNNFPCLFWVTRAALRTHWSRHIRTKGGEGSTEATALACGIAVVFVDLVVCGQCQRRVEGLDAEYVFDCDYSEGGCVPWPNSQETASLRLNVEEGNFVRGLEVEVVPSNGHYSA